MVGRQLHTKLEFLLSCAADAGLHACVLKGAALEEFLYPGPGFRPMSDIDLLVPKDQQEQFEAILRNASFVQRSQLPASFYDIHHHSMPFWHPKDHLWIEVHTRLFPPIADFLRNRQTTLTYGSVPAFQLDVDAQILYTSAHWFIPFPGLRGLVQLLDFALLIHRYGLPSLERPELSEQNKASFDCMLSVLSELVGAPYNSLSASNPERWRKALLTLIGEHYIIDGNIPGRWQSEYVLSRQWEALITTNNPILAICQLLWRYIFPPGQQQYSPKRLLARLHKATRN
jgi:hypothetical protein